MRKQPVRTEHIMQAIQIAPEEAHPGMHIVIQDEDGTHCDGIVQANDHGHLLINNVWHQPEFGGLPSFRRHYKIKAEGSRLTYTPLQEVAA